MKNTLISVMLLSSLFFSSSQTFAQRLDRLAFSSAGTSDNRISYVIGESFNNLFVDGNVLFDVGSQSSTINTGGIFITEVMKEDTKISCYPNPVQNDLFFTVQGIKENNLKLVILDIKGTVLKQEKMSNMKIMKCNVRNLLSGNYFIGIQNTNGEMYALKRFVKE